ncbi:hypothetical protein BYT27DRAFT_7107409, partial [Phlegmacium glaucopus]
MLSPPRLHGSSRTTGGILRGHALGNTLNAADFDDVSDMLHPIPGKVLVYSSNQDPANLSLEDLKPTTFVKHNVTSSIRPVLAKVAEKYSPIQKNRIFTFEEGLWNVRGRYEKAFEEDEELFWLSNNGEYVTHILIVSL